MKVMRFVLAKALCIWGDMITKQQTDRIIMKIIWSGQGHCPIPDVPFLWVAVCMY